MYAYIYRKNAKIYSKIVVAVPSTIYLCSFSIAHDDNLDCAVPPLESSSFYYAHREANTICKIRNLTLSDFCRK